MSYQNIRADNNWVNCVAIMFGLAYNFIKYIQIFKIITKIDIFSYIIEMNINICINKYTHICVYLLVLVNNQLLHKYIILRQVFRHKFRQQMLMAYASYVQSHLPRHRKCVQTTMRVWLSLQILENVTYNRAVLNK